MKKFFLFIPQSSEQMLHECKYEAIDNSLLDYGTTRFPAIPLINAHVEKGDRITVVPVLYQLEECEANLCRFEAELDALCSSKGITCDVDPVRIPNDNGIAMMLLVYQELIGKVNPDDELYADITFGAKPMPIVLAMVLQYAYRTQDNATIECVTYGQVNHHEEPKTARIYDVTALVQLDEIVRLLAEKRVANPASVIAGIIGE